MITLNTTKSILLLIASVALASCGGLKTFHEYARAGDTIAIPAGMQSDFSKDNITVTITPNGLPAMDPLPATDPSIRAVINFYPDPVSSMIISRETGENITPFAQIYASTAGFMANDDKDWFQTTVFLDLPTSLPTGLTSIEVSNGLGATHTVTLDIIPGTGTLNTFDANYFGGSLLLDGDMLDSLSRVNHHTVTFDATTIPYAIELNFTHDPGIGNVMVVNPLGYKKNLLWSDNAGNLKVILTPSKDGIIDHIKDFKFYVAGSATNMELIDYQAYNVDGNSIPPEDITATMTASN
jgi:hypothetical protein